MPDQLILPETIYRTLLAHARAEFPNEACGLLRGKAGRVSDILSAHNVALTPRTDYQVDAQSLLRALAWEDEGDELIAIYHSHPTTPARPSATDAAKAFYPDSIYLILSLQNLAEPQMAGYFLRPELILQGPAAAKLLQDSNFTQVRPGLRSAFFPAEFPLPDPIVADVAAEVAFYLIFDENDSRRTPLIRVVSVQPVDVIIEIQ